MTRELLIAHTRTRRHVRRARHDGRRRRESLRLSVGAASPLAARGGVGQTGLGDGHVPADSSGTWERQT